MRKVWCLKFHVKLSSKIKLKLSFFHDSDRLVFDLSFHHLQLKKPGFSLLHLPAVRRRTAERGRRRARYAYDTCNEAVHLEDRKKKTGNRRYLWNRNEDVTKFALFATNKACLKISSSRTFQHKYQIHQHWCRLKMIFKRTDVLEYVHYI